MLKLMKNNEPCLKQESFPVVYGEDVRELSGEMFRVMYENKGIGLSANQLGVMKRIIVVAVPGTKPVTIINPKVTPRNGGTFKSKEGCLSYPGKIAFIKRHKRVLIEGFDLDWKPIKMKLVGLQSVCAQHEYDHLSGKAII